MNKLYLLTGATGFIGKQIIKSLSAKDITCRVIVRTGKKNTLDQELKIEKIIETDDIFSESVEWWINVTENVDVVIHSAWYAEPGIYLTSNKNFDCLLGSLNMAKGAVISRVKKIVGIGSCFEYDLQYGILTVDTPLKPLTAYAVSKVCLFETLNFYLKQNDIIFNWCRIFYLFGEGEDERRFYAMLHTKLSNGESVELTSGNQIRDYLNVKDAANMITSIALDNKEDIIYNICSGLPVTIRQFAENIADGYGKKLLLKFGHRSENLVDPKVVLGIPNYKITNEDV